MMRQRIQQIRQEIDRIKQELTTIGSMRPGAVNRQYRDKTARQGIYHQLSYSRHGQSHTKHVRVDELAEIKRQVATYKRFRELVEQWVDLAIEESELTIADHREKE